MAESENTRYYRVTFKPLELYTFGTEMGAAIAGIPNKGKQSYIMTTNLLPDQTTILGTLRYLALRDNRLLDTGFNYSGRQNELKACIGPESFRFGAEKELDFGKIRAVSPLFLWNEKEEGIYIRNPFCNVTEAGYRPMKMVAPMQTSNGSISTPECSTDGYIAKEGFSHGFIGLNSPHTVVRDDDLFTRHVLPGNQITGDDDDNSFYKREAVSLHQDYAFAVYVQAANGTYGNDSATGEASWVTTANMGRKNAPFRVEFTELDPAIFSAREEELPPVSAYLKAMTESVFKDEPECWYYALSDLYSATGDKAKEFAILEKKNIRNLETRACEETGYINKRKKNERIHLIAAGSVFYAEAPVFGKNVNCQKIGYNIIAKLGGK